MLHEGGGQFSDRHFVLHDPHVEQHLADATRVARVEELVFAWVETLRELEQDGEEPFAIGVEVFTVHDHHVVDVLAAAVHERMPLRQIFRTDVPQHVFCRFESLAMHGVDVVRLDRLNDIMTLLRQQNRMLLQRFAELRLLDDTHEPVRIVPAESVTGSEVTAVVHKSLVRAVVVLPQPVQGGELREVRIELGDVLASIISLHICENIRTQGGTHMNRHVNVAFREWIRLMHRHSYGDVRFVVLLCFLHVDDYTKLYRRSVKTVNAG